MSVAIVILSCDSYNDAWDTFAKCFQKFWPQCSYKKYLVSNNCVFDNSEYETILTGKEISWSDKVSRAMNYINEDIIILLLEDYFLSKKIDEEKIKAALCFFENQMLDYLCLQPYKYMEKNEKTYSKVLNKNIYGKILQPSIWKKSYLKTCLYDYNFSAWEFEANQKNKSPKKVNGKDYCCKKYLYVYENGILQGKWYGPSISKIRKLGIEVNTSNRSFLPKTQVLKRKIFIMIYKVLPSFIIIKLRKVLEKLGFKFIT